MRSLLAVGFGGAAWLACVLWLNKRQRHDSCSPVWRLSQHYAMQNTRLRGVHTTASAIDTIRWASHRTACSSFNTTSLFMSLLPQVAGFCCAGTCLCAVTTLLHLGPARRQAMLCGCRSLSWLLRRSRRPRGRCMRWVTSHTGELGGDAVNSLLLMEHSQCLSMFVWPCSSDVHRLAGNPGGISFAALRSCKACAQHCKAVHNAYSE